MRIPVTDEELGLMARFEPHLVHSYPKNYLTDDAPQDAYLTDDAPEDAKKAFERFIKINLKQQEEIFALMLGKRR